jgi:hypothetical protein
MDEPVRGARHHGNARADDLDEPRPSELLERQEELLAVNRAPLRDVFEDLATRSVFGDGDDLGDLARDVPRSLKPAPDDLGQRQVHPIDRERRPLDPAAPIEAEHAVEDELLDSVDVELLDRLELELLDSSPAASCGVPAVANVAGVTAVLNVAASQSLDRSTFDARISRNFAEL